VTRNKNNNADTAAATPPGMHTAMMHACSANTNCGLRPLTIVADAAGARLNTRLPVAVLQQVAVQWRAAAFADTKMTL